MTLIIFLWEILILYYGWQFVRSLDLGLGPADADSKGTARRRRRSTRDANTEEDEDEEEDLARDETTLGDFEDVDPEDLLLSSLGRDASASPPPHHPSEWPSFVSPVLETPHERTLAKKASKGTLRLRRPRSSIALPGGFNTRIPSVSKSGPSFPPSEALDGVDEHLNGGEAYAVPFDSAPPTEVLLDTGLLPTDTTTGTTTEHHEHLLLHLEKIESVNYWRESLPTAVEGHEDPLTDIVVQEDTNMDSSLDPGLRTEDTIHSPPESTTSHPPEQMPESMDETLAVVDSADLETTTTGPGAARHRKKKNKKKKQALQSGSEKLASCSPDESSDGTDLIPSV